MPLRMSYGSAAERSIEVNASAGILKAHSFGIALGLLLWTCGVLATDFSDAPSTPKYGDCVGYAIVPSKMPPDVKREIDAANQNYRKKARDADDRFLRATGVAGKQWMEEKAASVERMLAALSRLDYPEVPTEPDDAVPSPEKMQKFSIKTAQWKLASLKVQNREAEEEAEAELRFAQRGGNTVALNILQRTDKELLEACKRDADRIYVRSWDSKRQQNAAPPSK